VIPVGTTTVLLIRYVFIWSTLPLFLYFLLFCVFMMSYSPLKPYNRSVPEAPKPTSRFVSRPKSVLSSTKKPAPLSRRVSAPAVLSGNGNSNWSITEAKLDLLPPFFILSKDSVCVDGDVGVEEVSSRIAEWLRLHSVAADFNGCLAECVTLDNCAFEVRLFRDSGRIVVEVRMIRGEASSYRIHADGVLCAAEGFATNVDRKEPTSTLIKDGNVDSDTVFDVLENVSELLRKDRIDACTIGMETLCLLTKVDKVGKKVASVTSTAVVLGSMSGAESELQETRDVPMASQTTAMDIGSGEDNDEMGFMSILFSLIRDKKIIPEDGDDINSRNPSFLWHLRHIRLLSFRTVNSAITVLLSSGQCLQERIARNLDNQGILESLVNVVRDAPRNPHEAWYAVRILTQVATTSNFGLRRVTELEVMSAVEDAHLYGSNHHVLLASDSQTLISFLRSYVNRF